MRYRRSRGSSDIMWPTANSRGITQRKLVATVSAVLLWVLPLVGNIWSIVADMRKAHGHKIVDRDAYRLRGK